MKDSEYMALLSKICEKKNNKTYIKNIRIIKQCVFCHISKLKTIHSAILNYKDFFKALSIYSSIIRENNTSKNLKNTQF